MSDGHKAVNGLQRARLRTVNACIRKEEDLKSTIQVYPLRNWKKKNKLTSKLAEGRKQ